MKKNQKNNLPLSILIAVVMIAGGVAYYYNLQKPKIFPVAKTSRELLCEAEKKKNSCDDREYTSWSCIAKKCVGNWEHKILSGFERDCTKSNELDLACLESILNTAFNPSHDQMLNDEKKCMSSDSDQINTCKSVGMFWNCDFKICLTSFELYTWYYKPKALVKSEKISVEQAPSFEKSINKFCEYFQLDTDCLLDQKISEYKKCNKNGTFFVNKHNRCAPEDDIIWLGDKFALCFNDEKNKEKCFEDINQMALNYIQNGEVPNK